MSSNVTSVRALVIQPSALPIKIIVNFLTTDKMLKLKSSLEIIVETNTHIFISTFDLYA